MRRSTWISVTIACAVIVAAGNLPRLDAGAVARWGGSGAAFVPALRTALARIVPPPHLATPRLRAQAAPRVAPRPAHDAHTPYAPPSLLVTRAARSSALRLPPAKFVAFLFAVAALVALPATFAYRAARDRRRAVCRMAGRGLSATRIARSAHMPQDAVRTLLSPGLGSGR